MSHLWQRPPQSYQNLLMRCAPGTHEAPLHLLRKHDRLRDPALDLAAGSGALLVRLRDTGLHDLTAVELNSTDFALPGLTPLSIDLNTDFSAAFTRRFSLITATEIIEHLECPHHFLRQIHTLLQPGGCLLLSTPNLANWVGRLKLLLTGKLRYFDEAQYRFNHHISPLPDDILRPMLNDCGFKLLDWTTAGSFFTPLKRTLLSPIETLARLTLGPSATGDVTLHLAQRL